MRDMKDSGVEWLNSIPNNWDVKRLKQILVERNEKNNPIKTTNLLSLSIERGVFPYSEKTGGGNKAKENFEDYKLTHENDIVLNSMNVVVGAVGLSRYYGCVSPVYYTLYSRNENYNINYYNNIFQSSAFQKSLWGLGNGIVVKESDNGKLNTIRMRIPMEKLNNVLMPIPPIEEQEKIAKYLDKKVNEIDSVIQKTKMTIEDYKKYKQSVITEAVTKGLDKNVEMKDCGIDYLGKIPNSWNIASIGKIFDFISGYAYKSEKFVSETNYQVLRLGNIKNDNLILNDKQVFINEDDANESQKVRVLKNDILFTMTGTRKKKDYFYTLIIKEENLLEKNLYINQRVGCFRTNNKNINMKYYNYLLKFQPIVDYIFLFETGTANQGNIGIETINTTMLTIPPIETQNEIVEYLDNKCIEINNLISSKEKMIDELQQYKKSLIYEYVTGKKEVI